MLLSAALAAALLPQAEARARARLVAPRSSATASDERLTAVEQRLAALEQRLFVLERIAPAQFRIFHYNVLADQYASNLQPWYLHGAAITPDERRALEAKFYEKDEEGKYVNAGWPRWSRGILSGARRAAAEAFDAEFFAWPIRKERLWGQVERADCDIVTLSECDHYDDFWLGVFKGAGYRSIWRKRPRDSSCDGCAIAWRRSVFELIAHAGVDFADSYRQSEQGQTDRTFLMALFRFRRNPEQRLVVVTTHLARNPEKKSQKLPRGYQYGTLFRELLNFATEHNAVDVPVVVTGDLNAQCVDELSAMAKAVAVATGGVDKVHPVLNALLDAPTSATTKTEAREMRIDYLLYQTSKLRLLGVGNVRRCPQTRLLYFSWAPPPLHAQYPLLEAPMPNAEQPSDHTPISASFLVKSTYSVLEDNARTWLNVVTGAASSVRPLLKDELRDAFSFFDKDGSGRVSPLELQSGMALLNFVGPSAFALREAVASVPGNVPADRVLDFENFCRAFVYYISGMDNASPMQLKIAFDVFDDDKDGLLTIDEFRESLSRMAPAPVEELLFDLIVAELDADGDGLISITEWLDFCRRRYAMAIAEVPCGSFSSEPALLPPLPPTHLRYS